MNNNNQHNILIIESSKSMGAAILLTIFFGPFGLLYATVSGGLTMIVLGFVLSVVTLGVGVIFLWPINIIIAIIAVSSHNQKRVISIKQTYNETKTEASQDDGVTAQYRVLSLEVNRKSDAEIDSILLENTTMLNPLYLEVLKNVQQIRLKNKEFYVEASQVTAERRAQLLSNVTTLNTTYVKALEYLNRTYEVGVEPSFGGFMRTFDLDYRAPETPSETTNRLNFEKSNINTQKNSYTVKLAVIGIIILVVGGALIYKDYRVYDTEIAKADSLFNKESNEESLRLYNSIEVPFFGRQDRREYIESQVEILNERVAKKKNYRKN